MLSSVTSPPSTGGSGSGSAPSPSPSPSLALSQRARAASTAAEEAAEHAVPKFSDQLEVTIKEVFPSEDPLDANEFDPIQFIK